MQKKKCNVVGACLHTLVYAVVLTMLVLVCLPFSAKPIYAAGEKKIEASAAKNETIKESKTKKKTAKKETDKEKTTKEKNIKRVYDYAKAFEKEERQDLEELSESYYKETGYNYLVVTTTTCSEYKFDSTDDRDENDNLYTDACYAAFVEEYGEDYEDCVLLMLDLSDNRNAVVSGQGEMEYLVDDDDCDSIFEDIVEYLSDDDYYTAAEEFMADIEYYVDEESLDDSEYEDDYDYEDDYIEWDDEYDSNTGTSTVFGINNRDGLGVIHIVVSLLITSVIMWFMISRAGGKITVDKSTYMDERRSRIVAKEDRYIRTKRTKRRISSDTDHSHHSSSGGSSGGSFGGGGGGSHGGGHF